MSENLLSATGVAARLDRLRISRFHITVLTVASLSLFFDTLDSVVTGFVLSTLRVEWGFDVVWIGILSAIGTAGFWLGSLTSGFVADRIGRKRVIMYTLVAYSALSASRGLADDLTMFAILNFLTWLFIGAESSIVPVYLSELWPSRYRARLSGWMMMFFALGLAAAPLWAFLIIPTLGWEWAFYLTGPFAVLIGLMRRGLPESPRWLQRIGRKDDAEMALQSIERRASKGAKLAPFDESLVTQVAEGETARPRLKASALLSKGYRARTLMLWCAWFAQYGVLYAFLTFVPTLLALDGIEVTRSLLYSIVIYAAYIPGYVFGGYLAERMDRKWLIGLAFMMTAVFGTLFGSSSDPALIMLFGALTAVSAGLGATGVYTYTPELYPTEIRATAMGVASSWGRIGSITLLLVFGIFAVLEGKLFLFVVADVILIGAAIVVAIFGPSVRNRTLEESSRATTLVTRS